jgi:chaperone BCS1
MIEFLKHVLSGNNQFASGGLLLMIIGGISVYLRAVPARLWYWLVYQTTIMITVKDDDAAFVWVKEWLLEQEFLKRVRQVDLDTTLRSERLALVLAPGSHWFWYGGRLFTVFFYRSQDVKGGYQSRRSESLTFRTIGRKQAIIRALVDEIARCHRKRVGVRSTLNTYNDGWYRVQAYAPRSLDSVILKSGEKERLIQDIGKFKRSRSRYRRLGVPYHRGYLLYGPPGTGKTSLVSAIAAKFEMSIYAVNLAQFNDRTLVSAINDVPPKSVILFEDIDCMRSGKARELVEPIAVDKERNRGKDKSEVLDALGVTLSGLLSVLDGFHAPENVLFVMTSNRIENLDAALLRPGRIDYRLYMGAATIEQKIELYRRFFPTASEFEAELFVEERRAVETMAEFQGLLLALERELKHEGSEVALI